MHYEKDENNYIIKVFFGCTSDDSTEYLGAMPNGYTDLIEWSENENIRAWRIENGNLVYDASKDAELQAQYIAESENNSLVTQSQLAEALDNSYLTPQEKSFVVSNAEAVAQMLPKKTVQALLHKLTDASDNAILKIRFKAVALSGTISNNMKFIFNGRNVFKNTAASKTENGLNFKVNTDKTITINGTATAYSQLAIAGTTTNTDFLFALKRLQNYYLESLPTGVTVTLYSNDGNGLTQVYSGSGGEVLSFTNEQYITYATINVAANTTLTNATVSLMLSAGTVSVAYEKYIEDVLVVSLGSNTIKTSDELIIDENGNVKLIIEPEDPTEDPQVIDLGSVTLPHTFSGYTTAYASKVGYFYLTYKKANFDNEVATGNGQVSLRDTAEGYGSIYNLTIKNLTAGALYKIGTTQLVLGEEFYTIDLTSYSGTVDVVILNGKVTVYQNNEDIGNLDDISIKTFDETTYIRLYDSTDTSLSNQMTCEYNTDSLYCTRAEKNASVQIVQDSITSIVSSVGADGKVTAASIVQAINDDTSSIQISADKIDITGTTFPSIQNATGTCVINSNATYTESGVTEKEIRYTAPRHQFNGRIKANNDIETTGGLYNDGQIGFGTYNGAYIMFVDVNGNLSIYPRETRIGKAGNNPAIKISQNGDIDIYSSDVTIHGDLTVMGTITN